MKKILCLLMITVLFLALVGCGKTKTLHCDNCNKEVVVKESSNMEEDWAIYCAECNEQLFGDEK